MDDVTWVRRWDVVSLVSAIFVAIGVCGEALSVLVTWYPRRRVEHAIEAQIELERLERTRLEARLAPRVLTGQEQTQLAEQLRRFGPRRIDLFVWGNTPEITRFTGMLRQALLASGWDVSAASITTPQEAVSGVLIQTRRGAAGPDDSAASVIHRILSDAQIVSRVLTNDPFELPATAGFMFGGRANANDAAPIRILIGAKE